MRRISFLIASIVAFCSGSVGCAPSDPLGVQPTEGVVTFQGKPISAAVVIFKPRGEGRAASGQTDVDGRFTLFTSGSQKSGAIAGNYDVLISKTIDVDSAGNEINYDQPYDPQAKPQVRGKTVAVIPQRYNQADDPQLSADVVVGNNAFRFDLTD